MAAGIIVAHDRIGPFRDFVETMLSFAVEVAQRADMLLIDGAITAGVHILN